MYLTVRSALWWPNTSKELKPQGDLNAVVDIEVRWRKVDLWEVL